MSPNKNYVRFIQNPAHPVHSFSVISFLVHSELFHSSQFTRP